MLCAVVCKHKKGLWYPERQAHFWVMSLPRAIMIQRLQFSWGVEMLSVKTWHQDSLQTPRDGQEPLASVDTEAQPLPVTLMFLPASAHPPSNI